MSYRVLIVGLGNIGLQYDLHLDTERFALTHARAFSRASGYELACGVDPIAENRRVFEARYACPSFATVAEALAACAPEVVVIAASTAEHDRIIQQVLDAGTLRAVLCEKPLAFSLSEAATIVARCEHAGVALYVDYMRRADPAVREIKDRIDAGTVRGPVRGMAWYSKGMLNSASHIVDLCSHWFGAIDRVRSLGSSDPAGAEEDPRPAFEISFARGTIAFLPAERHDYFVNTLDCLAQNGRLYYDLSSAAVTWQPAVENGTFAGYRTLAAAAEYIPTDLPQIQLRVADELARALAGEPTALCTGRDALALLEHLTTLRTQC